MRLEPADREDRRRIAGLLRETGLPYTDLDESPVDLYVAVEDGLFVGAGGLERYGPGALLRSLVVPETRRGGGVGTAIYREIETVARDAGVERLYLLTDDAAGFFESLGFVAIDRATAPDRIRSTAEFETLCDDDATCMRRYLE